MILLGTPKEPNNYIMISFKMGNRMHELGFPPKYKDSNGLWFTKTKEFLDAFTQESIRIKSDRKEENN